MQGVRNIFHRIGQHVTEKLRVLLKFWLTQGVFKSFSFLEVEKYVMIIRDGWLYQIGWIFGKIPNGLWPTLPHFWMILLQFLWWIWLHICKEVWGPDSMKCMHMFSRDKDHSDFSQYNCWKNIPWTLNLLFLYQFHAKESLFKVPEISNINFWIENDPPPLWNFSKKIIQFGSQTLP